MEAVQSNNSHAYPLLVAEYQVDPVMKVLRDKVALQRLPVLADKVFRASRPRRQLDVVEPLAILQV